MSNKIVALLAVPLVALAWYAGLRTGERNAAPAPGLLPVESRAGTPVATFEGQSISLEELKAQIEEQAPIVRLRYTSAEGKRDFLERMVRTELLAREAQRRGYGEDPDVLRQHKRNLVAVFVQKEFEAAQLKQPIPEPEIKKFYDEHLAEFVKPERVRVAQVFVAAPAADARKRAEGSLAAARLLEEALAKDRSDYIGFQRLARERSDDSRSKVGGGDLQMLTREQLLERAGAEVAQAAFGLKEPGQVLESVVETPEGFHVLKLLGREVGLDMSLEEARESIRSRIVFERRSSNYQKFVAAIEAKAGLEIDTAKLNALQIESGGPSRLPPGAIPPAPPDRGGRPVAAPGAK